MYVLCGSYTCYVRYLSDSVGGKLRYVIVHVVNGRCVVLCGSFTCYASALCVM